MREDNIKVFNDTLSFINENDFLHSSIIKSGNNTRIYDVDEYPSINNINNNKDNKIIISKHRSLEAAMILHKKYPYKKIGVLNFMSATTPGGGVLSGSNAQEESLCRCSTLYPVLNTEYLYKEFYLPNRKENNPLHNDKIIYSPDIIICKSDTDSPKRLSKEDFVCVDIFSSAAPNLNENPSNMYNYDGYKNIHINEQELYLLHKKRIEHILHIAIYHHIDILILGAFGCGAFKNDPRIVSKAMKEAVDKYKGYFDAIELAIYCSMYDEENYLVFKDTFEK